MFGIGSTELLVILLVALIVLGPKSLATISRSLGKAMGEFRRVSTEFQRTLNAEVAAEEERERRENETGNVSNTAAADGNSPQTSAHPPPGSPLAEAVTKTSAEGASSATARKNETEPA